jgi:hypothetical protein
LFQILCFKHTNYQYTFIHKKKEKKKRKEKEVPVYQHQCRTAHVPVPGPKPSLSPSHNSFDEQLTIVCLKEQDVTAFLSLFSVPYLDIKVKNNHFHVSLPQKLLGSVLFCSQKYHSDISLYKTTYHGSTMVKIFITWFALHIKINLLSFTQSCNMIYINQVPNRNAISQLLYMHMERHHLYIYTNTYKFWFATFTKLPTITSSNWYIECSMLHWIQKYSKSCAIN